MQLGVALFLLRKQMQLPSKSAPELPNEPRMLCRKHANLAVEDQRREVRLSSIARAAVAVAAQHRLSVSNRLHRACQAPWRYLRIDG